ncbi:MAG: hypothetical protein HY820_37755 [Acidobacteria bacterium]|nr:hypothetical protein [Acidobacteriota bacterium]
MRTNTTLLPVFLMTVTVFAQTGKEIPSAFLDVRQEARQALPVRDAAVRRHREAAINIRLFDREAVKAFRKHGKSVPAELRKVRMNLFPDTDLVIQWDRVDSADGGRSVVWAGSVDGQPLSQAILVVTGGAVTGNIVSGGVIYQIRPGDNGIHSIGEADPSTLPLEGEPLRPPSDPPPGPGPMAELAPDDNGAVIDVMVAYTAAARQAAGGVDRMVQQIQLGIAETNQGYVNSRVNHRLRLVGYGEVNYQESGDFDTDLNRLSSAEDGIMDEVHAARDRLGADLVSLWVEKGDYCGLAWILANPARPNPGLGFSVVRRDCATGSLTFGHELGHNLGATHALEDPTSRGAYPYSHGFKQTTRAPYFRSVMAYDCPGGCPRVNYWSSPDLAYQGMAIGTRDTHDNRTTLNNTAAIVAAYRRSTQTSGTGFPESAHPYADNFDQTWSYTLQENPASIVVTFDPNTFVEEGWDYIVITDGNGREIAGSPFTGDQLSNKYVVVPGATVKIRLVSDESVNGYGFKVAGVRAASNGGGSDLATVSFTASTSGTIGGKINGAAAKVENQGQAAAGAFRIAFYWISESGESTFSGWSCAVEGLSPGASFTCSGDLGVLDSLRPGRYRIVAIADDERRSGDGNWDNNARASEAGLVTLR